MNESIKEYKLFIDSLVSLSKSSVATWVVKNGYPAIPENTVKNNFVNSLSKFQKLILAQIINEAKESGIHDVLAYLSENQDNLQIIKNGVQLPNEPFGTEINFDFVARNAGDEWPAL